MPGAHDSKISAALGTAVLLALSACSQESAPSVTGTATAKKAAPQVKRGPSVEELTTGMVQATPLGKSSVQLDLKFDLGARPVKGQPLELNVALIPLDSANQTTVTLTGTQGFDAPDPRTFDFDHLDTGEVYRHTIKLTPSSEGVLLVGLTVTVSHDDITDTKEFSIPVIVGH